MDKFAFTVPQREEINIEIDDDGFVEITQSNGSLDPDNLNTIRVHKTDLEFLIIGLQEAAKSRVRSRITTPVYFPRFGVTKQLNS